MKDVVVIIGGPPPEEVEDMFGKALKVEGLTKENGDLRKMCDDYRSAIEKLRAKVVEQDKVIEKLAMANSSPGKSSMSC